MKIFKKILFKILKFLKKNPLKILFVIFFLSLSSYVVLGMIADESTKAQEKEFDPEIKGDNPIAIDVDVILVKKEDVKSVKNLPARVSAFETAKLRPQIDGIIRQVNFVDGSYVTKGQQLYQIDDEIYQANLKQALANFKFLAKKKYRFKRLLKIGAISRQEFDEVYSNYIIAKQDLKKAEIDLEYTKVLAPISGHISIAKLTKGELVSVAQDEVLAIINQVDPIYVDIRYPAKDFDILRRNLDAEIEVETNNSKIVVGGKIDSFEKEIDALNDSFLIRAKFDNKNFDLVPNMYVDVKLSYNIRQGLTIPLRSAYRDFDGSLFVWVVNNDNIVEKRTINVAGIYDDKWIIQDGLAQNDQVIYEGVQKIYVGALVNPNLHKGGGIR